MTQSSLAQVHPSYSTADLFDLAPEQVQVCDVEFRSFGGYQSFAGPCATLRVSDHSPVREMLSSEGRGRVLIIEQVPRATRVAVLGDRLAELAITNGWSGIVVYGLVRDTVALSAMPIGIMATGSTARRESGAVGLSSEGLPLEIGGAVFSPEVTVVADLDAVITCPPALLETQG